MDFTHIISGFSYNKKEKTLGIFLFVAIWENWKWVARQDCGSLTVTDKNADKTVPNKLVINECRFGFARWGTEFCTLPNETELNNLGQSYQFVVPINILYANITP